MLRQQSMDALKQIAKGIASQFGPNCAAMPAASCLSISKRFSSIAHLSAIFLHPHDTTLFSEINGFPKKIFRNPDFLFDICVLCDMIKA